MCSRIMRALIFSFFRTYFSSSFCLHEKYCCFYFVPTKRFHSLWIIHRGFLSRSVIFVSRTRKVFNHSMNLKEISWWCFNWNWHVVGILVHKTQNIRACQTDYAWQTDYTRLQTVKIHSPHTHFADDVMQCRPLSLPLAIRL